ncbi:MAG: response regulator transcription factor [Flavobacteriales bacterium]|nr:response regulator transcription factor [Flavobacteriales bacterium]
MHSIPRVISVAVVEDDREVRQALQLTLAARDGFRCASTFSSCEDALKQLPEEPPDVVLMDINLPGMDGIAGVKALKELLPGTDFLMLTVREEEDTVFRALSAGASGYILKHASPEAILEAITEVYEGGSAMTPVIARLVVRSFQPKAAHDLSDRELEVLAKLCDGENYRSIAEALFISTNTVKAHIKSVYLKLHVHTRAEAVRKALRDRLV